MTITKHNLLYSVHSVSKLNVYKYRNVYENLNDIHVNLTGKRRCVGNFNIHKY